MRQFAPAFAEPLSQPARKRKRKSLTVPVRQAAAGIVVVTVCTGPRGLTCDRTAGCRIDAAGVSTRRDTADGTGGDIVERPPSVEFEDATVVASLKIPGVAERQHRPVLDAGN